MRFRSNSGHLTNPNVERGCSAARAAPEGRHDTTPELSASAGDPRDCVLTLLTVLSDSRTKVLLNSSLLNFFTVFWPLKPNQISHAEDALKLF
jgi:hypothetical protein